LKHISDCQGAFLYPRTKRISAFLDLTTMANLECCHLCRSVTYEAVLAGIDLPLKPYLRAWKESANDLASCGLCELVRDGLGRDIGTQMDCLMFRYNHSHHSVVVIASVTESLRGDSAIDLLCSATGPSWRQEIQFNSKGLVACVFLRLHCGVGTSTVSVLCGFRV
jgi:hypothetical protein